MRAWAALVLCAALSLAGASQGCVLAITGGGLEGRYIHGVPDVSQPPPNLLGFASTANWSAPLSAANVIAFLATTVGYWGRGVSGNLAPGDLSAYLGYFMATNGAGSPDRVNSRLRLPGTLLADIAAGIREYARWDPSHRFYTPPPAILNKAGADWNVSLLQGPALDLSRYRQAVGTGIPPLVVFAYWNPVDSGRALWLDASGRRVNVRFYAWGPAIASTEGLAPAGAGVPVESWDAEKGIGHIAVGVGYLQGDPDGPGPLPDTTWLLVHDTWAATAEHVAIPWVHVLGLVTIGPAAR